MDKHAGTVGIKDHINPRVVGKNFHILNRKEVEVQVEKEERNPKTKRETKAHFQERKIGQDRFQTVIETVIEVLKLILNQLQKVQDLLLKEHRDQTTSIQEPEEQKL